MKLSRPFSRYPFVGLASVLLSVAVVQAVIVFSPFPEITGDSFFRALMVYKWKSAPFVVSRDPGAISSVWLPPYFWLTGSVSSLTGNPIWSMRLVSWVSSIVGLAVIYALTRSVAGSRSAIISVVLVGFIPVHLWLSVSMLDTTLYLLCGVLAILLFLHWLQSNRVVFLLGTSVAILACTMVRPEGWIIAGLFLLYLAGAWIRRRHVSRYLLITSGIISCLFVGFWLGDNWVRHGNPLSFLLNQKALMDASGLSATLDWWVRLLQPLFFMMVSSPLLFLLASAAVVSLRLQADPLRDCFVFTALYVGVLSTGFLFGAGTEAIPQRYGLLPLVALVPVSAWLLSKSLERGGIRKLATLGFLALYIGIGVFKGVNYPSLFSDAMAAGRYLHHHDSKRAAERETFATEWDLRVLLEKLPRTRRDFSTLVSEHAAIVVFAGRPDAFITNPLDYQQSLVDQSITDTSSIDSGTLGKLLDENGIEALLIRDRELMQSLPVSYRLVRTFGRYSLLSSRERVFPEDSQPVRRVSQQWRLAEGIVLASHYYHGSFFPVTLELQWLIRNDVRHDADCPYWLRVELTREGDSAATAVRRIRPIFCWVDGASRSEHHRISDYVPLDLPKDLLGGAYSVSIALERNPQAASGSRGTNHNHPIELPPVDLGVSKRAVLKDYLLGRHKDALFVLRVLASI